MALQKQYYLHDTPSPLPLLKPNQQGTSLVVQHLRPHLPMQGVQV